MRVFLTGATGFIGNAVAAALRARNHDVLALVRAEADSRRLRDRGVTLVGGDLESLPALAAGGALDGVDAFVQIAQPSRDPVVPSRTALETFLGRNRYTLYTSGVWVLGAGRSDETTPVRPFPLVTWRVALEELVLQANGGVLRPGCVYGGKQSLLGPWFEAAAKNEPVAVVGEGDNHWALVDLHDLTDCYVKIIEARSTGIHHAVDDTRATLNECARAVAGSGTITNVAPPPGPFGEVLVADQEVSSDQTRRRLGWQPSRDFLGSVREQWDEWRAETRSAAR
jgi:nucleoside-diphosphate-sugar epimerase